MFIDFGGEGGREGEGQREGEGGGEREKREKHRRVASRMCPDQGLNLQPFGVRDDAPTN